MVGLITRQSKTPSIIDIWQIIGWGDIYLTVLMPCHLVSMSCSGCNRWFRWQTSNIGFYSTSGLRTQHFVKTTVRRFTMISQKGWGSLNIGLHVSGLLNKVWCKALRMSRGDWILCNKHVCFSNFKFEAVAVGTFFVRGIHTVNLKRFGKGKKIR